MPAFLAQLAAPAAQLVRATGSDGTLYLYLFDPDRESFAAFTEDTSGWTVRQGGPVALWDDVEQTLTAWQDAGQTASGNTEILPRPRRDPARAAEDHDLQLP
jgi:hypothetical protein